MKKRLLGICLAVVIIACDKDPVKTNDPIKISSEVTNVSIYALSDGAITLSVEGGTGTYSYAWSNGATTRDLSMIPAGEYSVTVTDTDDETAEASATVNEPTLMAVSYEKTDESSVGAADGSISLTISGGTEPYTISWSHGPTTAEVTGLTADTYTVTVGDAAGALQDEDIEILAPLTLSYTQNDVSSYDLADGEIDLTITGGQEPYTISWSNGSSSEDLSGLKAGYYQASVTDNAGTLKRSNISLYEPYDKGTDIAALIENTTRLKQAGIRMEAADKIIYIDPINLLDAVEADADIILITHSHSDHFQTGIISQLANAGTSLLVPESCYSQTLAAAPTSTVLQIAKDSIKTIEGIEIEVVPAYNSNHAAGCVGYILNIGSIRVYHAGDTERITEMKAFGVDIAILPLGQTYTFPSIEEAANAARDVAAKVVIPIHYGLYEGTLSDPWTLKDMLSTEIDVAVKPSFTE